MSENAVLVLGAAALTELALPTPPMGFDDRTAAGTIDLSVIDLQPGATLGELLPSNRYTRPLAKWMTVVRGEYLDSRSNLTNYDYDNWTVSLLFSRRWAL